MTLPPFLNENLLFAVLTLEAIVLLPILSAFVLAPSRKEKELRTALAQALTKNEELEKKVRELEDLNRGLQKQLKEREEEFRRKLEEELNRAKEECDRKLREAIKVSKTAMTLLEAIKAGAVKLADRKGECVSIILEPNQVLCKERGRVLKVIWPEERAAGEEEVIIEAEGQAKAGEASEGSK